MPKEIAALVREQVATINTCAFCMDSARWYATRKAADSVARFDALAEYGTSPLFSDAERVALDYASELTRDRDVRPETVAALRHHYGDREICDIVWLVASEHLYNITNVGLGIGSDGLCELAERRAAEGRQAVRSV